MVVEIPMRIGRLHDVNGADSHDGWRRVYDATPPEDGGVTDSVEHEVLVRLEPSGDVKVLSNPSTCARVYGPLVVKVEVRWPLDTAPEAISDGLRCVAHDADGLARSFDWRASRAEDRVLVVTFVSTVSIRRMFRWAIEARLPAV